MTKAKMILEFIIIFLVIFGGFIGIVYMQTGVKHDFAPLQKH